MRGQQDYIKRVFDTKSIPYEEIDVAAPQCAQEKKFMQEVVGRTKHHSSLATGDEQQQQQNEPILPPQLFHNDAYRGVSVFYCITFFVRWSNGDASPAMHDG